MSRPEPPDLEFRTPECSICQAETECDGDGFHCFDCDAWWSRSGEGGNWDEPDAEQCPSTDYNPWSKITHRCVRAVGHEGSHESAETYCGWNDSTAKPTPVGDPS